LGVNHVETMVDETVKRFGQVDVLVNTVYGKG